jgi:Putative transposase DNA-binding domain
MFTGTAACRCPSLPCAVVKRVVKVRLLPTEVESAALAATLTACNAAAAWLSTQVHRKRVRNKIDAHASEAIAGQEDQIGATTAAKASPQGAAVRCRHQPSDQQEHRGRGQTHRTGYCHRAAGWNPRAGTVSQAPTGRVALLGVRPTWPVSGLKAQAAGVAFVRVNPAYTSQTCSACGYIDKGNRRSQSVFDCARCDFVGHADHNAANNIAMRGVARWGEVMRPHAAPTLAAS